MNQIAKAQPSPESQLRAQLEALRPQFQMALPSHIKPEKLQRVVMTVVQQQPELLQADRRSLLGAVMKCAADGLVPDGREAALVLFNGRVQYMPMLAGILKRARNSGEIASINVQVVYEKDRFVWRPSEEKAIEHEVPSLSEDRGKPIGAYAIVRLKDGDTMHEVMSLKEIEKVRAVSRAKNAGPWTQWWDQMARKTVLRRLSKYLPMDADAERLFRRDDDLGAPNGDADAAPLTIDGTAEPGGRLAALESAIEGEAEPVNGAGDDGIPPGLFQTTPKEAAA